MAKQGYMPPAKTVEWETPQAFFDRLDAEFHFSLDAAATLDNAKCVQCLTRAEDALSQSWHDVGAVYCNPPYGRVLAEWVRKAYTEAQTSKHPVIMLIPARTDTRWWHEYVMQADEIRFVKGRLKFGGAANSATFPSVVVVFRALLADDCIAPGNTPYISSMPAIEAEPTFG